MFEDINVTKAICDFTAHNLDKFYGVGKELYKDAADFVRLRLDRSYNEYLTFLWKRYSGVRSFFNRNESIGFYKLYVPINLIEPGREFMREPSAPKIASKNPFSVISGSGGSGKTILMRHLLMSTILTKEKVPLFAELRDFTSVPDGRDDALFEYLKNVLHANHLSLDDEYISKAFEAGHFLILLDGFDEVPLGLRREIGEQITSLARKYNQNWVFVSSRPDPIFSNWLDFTIMDVAPLTKQQACSLVEKLPYDEEIKTNFLSELRDTLYAKHQSFLSNPLLLSIMLLTYSQDAEIPNKLNVFYGNAYDALFQRHDAMKGGFKRQRYSSLDSQDFAGVFAGFSLASYDARSIQMARNQALDFIVMASKITGINTEPEAFLADAIQSVCLLVDEGLWVSFAHRSFQEYFVARFIESASPDVQGTLILRYSTRFPQDSTLLLLNEINPALVNRLFLIPKLNELIAILGSDNVKGIKPDKFGRISGQIDKDGYLRFLNAIASGVKIRKNGEYTIDFHESALVSALQFAIHVYGQTFKDYWAPKGFDWSLTVSRYASDGRILWIGFEKLESSDALLKDAFEGLGAFSGRGLVGLLLMREHIQKLQKAMDRSLSEILKTNWLKPIPQPRSKIR
jgi:hypothetical protein